MEHKDHPQVRELIQTLKRSRWDARAELDACARIGHEHTLARGSTALCETGLHAANPFEIVAIQLLLLLDRFSSFLYTASRKDVIGKCTAVMDSNEQLGEQHAMQSTFPLPHVLAQRWCVQCALVRATSFGARFPFAILR